MQTHQQSAVLDEPEAVAPAPPARTGRTLIQFTERYALVALLAIVIIFFALLPATSAVYLSHANLTQLIGNQVVVSVVALAALIPLSCNLLDLSTGAICGISSIACATAMSDFGLPTVLAIVIGVVVGALLGGLNGLLISRYGLDAIVTTLGMSIALAGLMVLYTDGNSITHDISPALLDFGSFNWLGIPRLTYALVPIIAATWYVLECTPFGRQLMAIRSNPRSAHLVGINVRRTILISFVSSGLLAGIAGVLLTARAGSADATTGPSFLFPALAAVMLGVTTIKPGRPNVLGAVVGVFFVAFSVSGLSLLGASSWAPPVLNGTILVAAAGLAAFISRKRGHTSTRPI